MHKIKESPPEYPRAWPAKGIRGLSFLPIFQNFAFVKQICPDVLHKLLHRFLPVPVPV